MPSHGKCRVFLAIMLLFVSIAHVDGGKGTRIAADKRHVESTPSKVQVSDRIEDGNAADGEDGDAEDGGDGGDGVDGGDGTDGGDGMDGDDLDAVDEAAVQVKRAQKAEVESKAEPRSGGTGSDFLAPKRVQYRSYKEYVNGEKKCGRQEEHAELGARLASSVGAFVKVNKESLEPYYHLSNF